jgi:autotransporter-associated beta strand protein
VKRSLQAGGPYETIASGLTATNFTNSGLSSGTTYYYVVAATNATASSADSEEVSAQPPPGIFQKADNSTALDLGGSWVPGSSPTALDTALWDGTYASGVVGIGAGLSLRKLQLANPSQAITINTGSGPLMIGDGGIDLSTSTKSLTHNPPVVWMASQAWPVTNNCNLYLNQIISDGGAGYGLAFAGAGSIVLASNNTYTGATTLSAGTLHLGVSTGSSSGAVGGPLNLFGGTLRSNRTGEHEPIAGVFYATNGTLQVNMASGVFKLNANNLTAGSSNVLTTLTGANGATCVVDGDPESRLRFASSTAGFNVVVRKGQVLYNTNGGMSNMRVEGGSFTAMAADRFQLATSGQTFTVTSGEVILTNATTYGFRIGGSGNPAQAGAQLVTGSQSGGTVQVKTFNMGGTDTTAVKSPSYALTGGTLTTIGSFLLGADTTGLGSSTFTLNGTGKLVVPGTISGSQAGAKQIFAFTGGTLVAATINATNLRDQAGSSNGTWVQSGGTLAPGDEGVAGKTALTGNYSLLAGTLSIEASGTNQATAFQTGKYDYLTVSGTTLLAGDLAVRLINGFVPSNTTVFTVLNSSGVLSGAFGNVAFGQRLTTAGGEGSFLVTQSGNTVRLSDYRPALSALEAWRQLYFETTLDAGNAANNADPDLDGLSNLFEYAFGGIPNLLSSAPLPTLTYLNPGLRYSFVRARADVTYVFEISPDLVEWTHKVTNPGNVGETVVVEDTTGGPRRFLRLRITVAP